MVIDAHCHIFPPELDRSGACRRDPAFAALYASEKAKIATAQTLLEAMDSAGVERAVVCGFPWQDMATVREHNDYLLHCAAAWPGRLAALASLPPAGGDDALVELERCLGAGMAGAGEMAFYREGFGKAQRSTVRAALEILARCARPLLLHVNEQAGHPYPGKAPFDFDELVGLIAEAQGNDIVLAHFGGGFLFRELMPEIRTICRRVYYDTAASPYLYSPAVFPAALAVAGPGRLLLGTDYPLLPLARYLRQMDEGGVPQEARAAICGENARRLFFGRNT